VQWLLDIRDPPWKLAVASFYREHGKMYGYGMLLPAGYWHSVLVAGARVVFSLHQRVAWCCAQYMYVCILLYNTVYLYRFTWR